MTINIRIHRSKNYKKLIQIRCRPESIGESNVTSVSSGLLSFHGRQPGNFFMYFTSFSTILMDIIQSLMWNWPHFNSYAYVHIVLGALDCIFAIFQLHEWFHRKLLYQQLYQTLDSTSSTTLVDSVPFLQKSSKTEHSSKILGKEFNERV